jgi:hydrogenase nickel incorporation protein HypA/HybF
VSHADPSATGTAVHELSITQSVVDAVAEHAAGARVVAVRMSVGQLSGVMPDAMRFCFELITEGTQLQGARLDIDQPSGVAHCESCDRDFQLADLVLLCPCGSADVAVLAGKELRITSVEVV